MITASGKSLINGIAIGKISIYKDPERVVSDSPADDPAHELERFEEARLHVQDQQMVLYEKALQQVDKDAAGIFMFRIHLLDREEDLYEDIRSCIARQGRRAEFAVKAAFDAQAEAFASVSDPYFQARSTDFIDIRNAVLDRLMGIGSSFVQGDEPAILAAEDFTPSELVRLDKSLLLGIITGKGSINSHTAILARSMKLPSLIQCRDIDDSWDGKMAVLDGQSHCVYIDPPEELLREYREKQRASERADFSLQSLKGRESVTKDGAKISLYANIGGPEDIEAVLENDAEGVGLFRSEFLYLNSRSAPTEEEQFRAYRDVLQALAPRPVVIRTCDIGADKTLDYMHLMPEENPALGLRAIRFCLAQKDFFKTQLRALLRASAYGNLSVMFPMITSVGEVTESKSILAECGRELAAEGIKTGKVGIGIMIETPAAVFCADELAEQVDFFSVGTNDLTQYICAMDRQNAEIEPFFDEHHPAVFRAVQMTAEAAHRHNCRVAICGELGADPALTESFIRMGIDELSVDPSNILPLRKVVRGLDLNSRDSTAS